MNIKNDQIQTFRISNDTLLGPREEKGAIAGASPSFTTSLVNIVAVAFLHMFPRIISIHNNFL